MNIRELELLAPAKNREYGIAAIDYGADAVYIGGPKFGARSAAGNTVEDIAGLVNYARPFGAKVYAALNTVLFDGELEQARDIALKVWEAGADALIVQDMAYLEMELPPIPLFASTQTFNMSHDKVKFLELAGFSRVILERALSLEEIAEIRSRTTVELETFVHGAICVCYSGQCYMSQAVAGRSGNRGECLQPCRWDYDLADGNGNILERGKHLLSVTDLDLSAHLEELIDAGVSSFKIEGRLKELSYLKNSVSHYRQKLDEIIARRPELLRSSYGQTIHDFVADPGKSFSRGFSSYYLKNKDNKVASFDTPKSIGQFTGKVESVSRDSFTMESETILSNGDGISFFTSSGQHTGTNVNKSEGSRIWPNKMDGIVSGTRIYRNHDHLFIKQLERSRTRRAIPVDAEVSLSPDSITVKFTDPLGFASEITAAGSFPQAKDQAKMRATIITQLSKTGDTIYSVENVRFLSEQTVFVAVSVINELRRKALDGLTVQRVSAYRRDVRRPVAQGTVYAEKYLDYRGNVANRLSEKFYKDHGVESINKGFELDKHHRGKAVMRTKYCIRRERGDCLKEKGSYMGRLFLLNKNNKFELTFDCASCEMSVVMI